MKVSSTCWQLWAILGLSSIGAHDRPQPAFLRPLTIGMRDRHYAAFLGLVTIGMCDQSGAFLHAAFLHSISSGMYNRSGYSCLLQSLS
ncbi:hypothetical protein CALVIDRAFT_125935 [Calocera viscosa TUFC12733]|uniref:Uncharacterized protein n=1 Tax=Calocera viscosa (strain TUFC12733) TaxID=1330018 RepID=A0A167RQH6_CALVF|nr:hypothetical protein CALVIDRAFT_125935 [Calocera viscosa TUFC12733]